MLSRVPIICIENKVELVRDNPAGREPAASWITAALDAYFTGG